MARDHQFVLGRCAARDNSETPRVLGSEEKPYLTHPRIHILRRAEPKTRGCCLLPLSNRSPCAPRGLTLICELGALKEERGKAMQKIRFSIPDIDVDWKSESSTPPRRKPGLVSRRQVWMLHEVMQRRKDGAIDVITARNGLSRNWLGHWMSQHLFWVEFVSMEHEGLVYRFLLA